MEMTGLIGGGGGLLALSLKSGLYLFLRYMECLASSVIELLLLRTTSLYNAITQNNREIERVNKNELYIATVSIKLFLLTV